MNTQGSGHDDVQHEALASCQQYHILSPAAGEIRSSCHTRHGRESSCTNQERSFAPLLGIGCRL